MNSNNLCRGIECVFNEFSSILKFFESISNSNWGEYYFFVVDQSIFSQGKRVNIPREFSPPYIEKLVQQSFMCERLVLHLYPRSENFVCIDNYKDFLASNCELIILAYDCCYIDVYCKNQYWLKEISRTARSIPGTIVAEKYTNTDRRTSMYV